MAAILFTSGSTGVAKGVVYTHGIFAAQVEILRRLYGIEPGEVDLPTFPLFGLFGPALGMTSIIPRDGRDAARGRRSAQDPRRHPLLRRHQPVRLARPHSARRPLRRRAAASQLPTLRRVISAGAPVPWQAIERFAALLADGVQVHTPYGATEALPVCSIGSDEILRETRLRTAEGAGVCVGRPVEGMTVKIIRIRDEPIPDLERRSRTAARRDRRDRRAGPVVTASYWNRPESTALAKIADPIHDGFYHRMGDVGYLDASGRLWFCGRKSQRVVTPGGTLFTDPLRGRLQRASGGVSHGPRRRRAQRRHRADPVRRAREGTRPRRMTSNSPANCSPWAHAIHHTRAIQTILFHPSFPVDIRHNAKIFREKLAAWAAERLA